MSLDSHLIHTCTIRNPAAGAANVYNNVTRAFGTPVTGVRCRLVDGREVMQREVGVDELSEGYIKSVYTLFVRSDVDLQEKAEITQVTLEDGSVITDKFEVVSVLVRRGRRAHHKTATLERIS